MHKDPQHSISLQTEAHPIKQLVDSPVDFHMVKTLIS